MITKRAFAFPSALLIFVMLGIEIAQACMGVSRTINIRSFKAHMGTGASGGIGLRPKEVVLTFDDGPVTSTTNRVLAALDRECLKATFFVVGRMARNNPKLLQKIARKGHTIGHHTDDHANLRNVSLASAHRNIDKGRRAVNAALGPYRSRSSKLFRYPYLARSSALDTVLKRQRLLPLSAGIMSQDWKKGSSAAMINRVMSRLNRLGRGVILLHDIQAKTASGLPELLRRLDRAGYKVVHVRAGNAPGGQLIANNSSRSKKRKSQVVALKSTASEKSKRKRWSLFGRRTAADEQVGDTITGSVKKSSKSKKSRTKVVKRKKASTRKQAKAKSSGSIAEWLKKRRLAREALAAKQTKRVVRKKSMSNRKVTKKTARLKKQAKKTPKARKSLFAHLKERRKKNAAFARKKKLDAKKKSAKRNAKSSRKSAKSKRKSLFKSKKSRSSLKTAS